MTIFYNIWSYNNIKIVYSNIKDGGELNYVIQPYLQKKSIDETLYIIYHNKCIFSTEQWISYNIHLIHSSEDFEQFFLLHTLRHDSIYKYSTVIRNKIISLYDLIHTPYSSFIKQPHDKGRMIYVAGQIEIYKKNIKQSDVICEALDAKGIQKDQTGIYEEIFQRFNQFINSHIPTFKDLCDFEEYASVYTFSCNTQIFNLDISKTLVLHDVYYKDKVWYDAERKPLIIGEFDSDFEYKKYPKNSHIDISSLKPQYITESVMFLDYIYGFYNFGEFWDVIRRLIVADTKNIPLFHIDRNRVTGIEQYFTALGFQFPTKYLCRPNMLYHFNTVNISTIKNSGRGNISIEFAYSLNRLMNPELKIPVNKSYCLYLTRGAFGRSIKDESGIIDSLKAKHNFIFLNGSESLADTIHYFSNASLILGAHGSLMKNMIWCLKNPIFIELTPVSRSANPCFVGNSSSLGFQTMYFICDCDEKEQINLSDKQRDALLELIDILSDI